MGPLAWCGDHDRFSKLFTARAALLGVMGSAHSVLRYTPCIETGQTLVSTRGLGDRISWLSPVLYRGGCKVSKRSISDKTPLTIRTHLHIYLLFTLIDVLSPLLYAAPNRPFLQSHRLGIDATSQEVKATIAEVPMTRSLKYHVDETI